MRIRALLADSFGIGYSTRWVWSNEGDRTPTLERSTLGMIPARFEDCQQNVAAATALALDQLPALKGETLTLNREMREQGKNCCGAQERKRPAWRISLR
jgi:hypothetical protein